MATITSGGIAAGSITGVEALQFYGGDGADNVTGGALADGLFGRGGDDMLVGNAGDDILSGGAGNDVLNGGDGIDTAQYRDAASGVTVDLALQGSTQATGGAGNDTLISIENLDGSNYADVLKGDGNANNLSDDLGGDDQLYGNGGDDTLVASRFGGAATTVLLSGGAGNDTILFDGDATRHIDTATLDGGTGSDTIFASSLATGTILAGSDNDNVTVDTLGGTYTISLGAGSDTLSLANTFGDFRAAVAITVTDFATGSGGDTLDLSDWLVGDALINYTAGANPFDDGHLRLLQSGTDTLLQVDRYGVGDYSTLITFQNTVATAFTAANLNGLSPSDFIPGETFRGTSGSDRFFGGAGDDLIFASPGHDIVDGGAGTDQLLAYIGSAIFPAPTGPRVYNVTADHLSDSSGVLETSFSHIESVTVSTQYAGSFDNFFFADGFTGSGGVQFLGGAGNDMMRGSAGADYLSAGFGNNNVDGGAGVDTAYASIDGTLTSIAYVTRSGDITTVSQAGRGTDTYKNVEILGLYAARDDGNGLHVDASAYDRDLTFSLSQNDVVIGGSGNDIFLGGNGTPDTVAALTGGAGADTYRYYGLPGGLDGTTITDFSIQDRIDLSGATTDAQLPLTFIGSAAFSGVAGQYRFADVGGQTLVQVDNDGDGVADGTLTLANGAFTLVQTAPGSNILKLADLPTASIANVAIVEGGSGTSLAQFTISLSTPAAGPVTFAYATADGSATAGSDYSATSGTLTIAAGASSGTIAVPIIGDTIVEGNETFTLNLSSSGVSFPGGAAAIGTITNDDSATATLGNVTVAEGNSGTANAVFTVALSNVSATPVTFAYATANGTATAGSDYTATSGLLTIAAGASSGTIMVPVIGDLLGEGNEAFSLVLSSPNGAGFAGGVAHISATATIIDDETIGGAQNDVITGTSAADGLYGRGGNDTISGGGGNDIINGDDGNDLILGGAGDDVLAGGAGVDTVSYADATSGVKVSLALVAAQQTVGGGKDMLSGFEKLTGSNFGDNLTGDAGDNVISSGLGNDQVDGGDGNDTILGGAGSDILKGGNGIDTVSYADVAAGVTVNLSITTLQGTVGGGNDTLSGFENVAGSSFDDKLTGDAGANILLGGDGNDILQGGLGDDILNGGDGIDIASYAGATAAVKITLGLTTAQNTLAAGRDTFISIEGVTGSAFGDNLNGDANANVLNGGDGNDQIKGNAGDDLIRGGMGSDILAGGDGIDTVAYDDALAAVTVNLSITTLQGTVGAGNDTLSGFENLNGSHFNDTLTGDAGTNTIHGDIGNDVIEGGLGDDLLFGDAGTDTASYAHAASGVTVSLAILTAQDTIGAGVDMLGGFENLLGSAFADTLTGDDAANRIDGGAGDDHIFGGLGDDYILGSLGDDMIDGGAGSDTLGYGDMLSGVIASLATGTASGGGGNDSFTGIENLSGSAYADTLTGDGNANILKGGVGNDILYGGAGADQLFGDNGADLLTGGAGADMLTGGTSGDRFILTAAADSAVGADDIITDFNHAEKDKIDVSQVYAGKFSFIGTNAFDGHAGELHYATSGSDLLVSGDVNGDGQADFEIKLIGVHDVDVTDFFL